MSLMLYTCIGSFSAYPDEAVMELQAEEGGDDGAVPSETGGDDTFDGGLDVGAVALSTVEADLQRGVAGDDGEAQ